MDLTRTFRLAIATLLLVCLSSFAESQQRSSYDPAVQGRPAKPQQSFVDFTLGRINASNQDYGKCIDESRKLLLEETLKTGYFWSNLIALALLGCLFIVILYQHRVQARREWTLAEKLLEYEYAFSRANLQVNQASKRNAELIEAIRALGEAATRLPAAPSDVLERTLLTPARSRASSAESMPAPPPKINPTKPAKDRMATAVAVPETNGQIGLFKPEVDLIMKVNSLEQQLGHSQEEKRQLRRQLNDADQRVQAEQQKNRALKGA